MDARQHAYSVDRTLLQGPIPGGGSLSQSMLSPHWIEYSPGRTLFYYRTGRPDGPPALFVHGIGGWAEQWALNLTPFQHHNCYLVDLPGFGRSSPPPHLRYLDQVDYLVHLLQQEGLEQVIVAGNSMGGALALKLALDHPNLVSRLILATAAGIDRQVSLAFRLAVYPGFNRLSVSNHPWLVKLRWHAQFGDRSLLTPAFYRQVRAFGQVYDCSATYQGLVRSSLSLFGLKQVLTGELAGVSQPTLLAWGDRDRVIPVAQAHLAAALIPDARLEIFEGAGHYPHWEQAERFNQLVTDFLQRTSGQLSPAARTGNDALA